MDPDFIVETTHGSLWTFQPMTETAKNFSRIDLGIEGWQWLGPKFGIDARFGNDLVSSLEEEGFTLELK